MVAIGDVGLARGPWAHLFATVASSNFPPAAAYVLAAIAVVVLVTVATLVGRRSGRRALAQRLTALGSRLGIDAPEDDANIERALAYLEQVTGAATEAVADSSADAIRLRRSLDTLPQGVVICNESGAVVYRNTRANSLMASRRGDALAAQAVTELLEDAWDHGAAERILDLYGPPRRTLSVQARLIDDGRRALGVIAMIDDVSERRRLEEIRRDFVANVSHELKTPMGALGLLAETLVAEPDAEVARRLATRIQTEAFRVSRIIDDLLDLSRIESEQTPPREPVLVNLVMAEAVERVRATADQRNIEISLSEPDPPAVVMGDRRQLVSAMHALLENAVTYSYEGSTVALSGQVVRSDGVVPTQQPAAAPASPTDDAPATAGTTATAGPDVPDAAAATIGPGGTDLELSSQTTNGTSLDHGGPGRWAVADAGAGGESRSSRPAAEVGHGAPAHAAPEGAVHTAGSPGSEPAHAEPAETATAPDAEPAHAEPAHAEPAHAEPVHAEPVHAATVSHVSEEGHPEPPGVPITLAEVPEAASNGASGAHGPAHAAAAPETAPAAGPASPPPVPASGSTSAPTASTSAAPGSSRASRDTVRITVTDHGVGIPARDLERIFERFYRVDHGRSRETGGTGLGLSIVRHVANNHRGWVEVESREGEGSTFTLVLPLQPEQAT